MKEIFRLCLVLTVLCAVSAGVLAFVSARTAEPIAKALLQEKLEALRTVLPPFDNDPFNDMVRVGGGADSVEVYRAKMEGRVVGVAFELVAPDGYAGDINFMVGVNVDGVIQGIKILKYSETPGLGSKIAGEDFTKQYLGRSLADPSNWAVTKDGGTFVPITGATISSRAVTKAAARGLGIYEANRERITGAGDAEEGEDR
ncbi:MAG: RnfABCDGE type electron transport complex subunit G [Candidatus Krumholzibacteria bacterium]|jgi:electron transport complex protein RnfG|nr:RnfABCDGE type electron transport complex subunit G [Candidatus Krumholzibacteria bacterium]